MAVDRRSSEHLERKDTLCRNTSKGYYFVLINLHSQVIVSDIFKNFWCNICLINSPFDVIYKFTFTSTRNGGLWIYTVRVC